MASEAFVCSICREELSEPVSLPCGHSFDRTCVQSSPEFEQARSRTRKRQKAADGGATDARIVLKCPECRATHPTPLNLPINVLLRDAIAAMRSMRQTAGQGCAGSSSGPVAPPASAAALALASADSSHDRHPPWPVDVDRDVAPAGAAPAPLAEPKRPDSVQRARRHPPAPPLHSTAAPAHAAQEQSEAVGATCDAANAGALRQPSSSSLAGPSKSFRSDKPPLEWTAEEVADWVATSFDDEVVVKCIRSGIDGRRLRQLALWDLHPKYLSALGLGPAEDIQKHLQFKEFTRAIFGLGAFDEDSSPQREGSSSSAPAVAPAPAPAAASAPSPASQSASERSIVPKNDMENSGSAAKPALHNKGVVKRLLQRTSSSAPSRAGQPSDVEEEKAESNEVIIGRAFIGPTRDVENSASGSAPSAASHKKGVARRADARPIVPPGMPRSEYRFFLDEQAPRYKDVKGASQRSTHFKQMWEELSNEQRKPYEKMQAEDPGPEEARFVRKERTDRGHVMSEEAANGDGDAGSARPSGSPSVHSSKMLADFVNPDIPRDANWGRHPYATTEQFKDLMQAAARAPSAAFSKEVYGEVNPSLVQIIIKELGITKDDVFLDIGSGWGNVVFQVSAMVGCRCVGIEVREDLHEVSRKVNPIFERMMKEQGIQAGKCEFHCGDASEGTWVYTEYTKVFMNNFVFPEDISQKVLKLFEATLPDKAMLLTLRHLDKKYNPTSGYCVNSPLRIISWPFRHFRTSEDVVSWTASSMEGFVYTVARGANGIKREPAEAASSSSSGPAKKRASERDRKRQRTVAASPSMFDAPSSRDHEEESTCPSPMDMSAGAISVKVEPRSAAGGLLPPPPTIPTGPYNGKGVFPERANVPAAAASKGRGGPRDGPAPAALTPPSPDDADLLAVLLNGAAPPQHVRPPLAGRRGGKKDLRLDKHAPTLGRALEEGEGLRGVQNEPVLWTRGDHSAFNNSDPSRPRSRPQPRTRARS